MANTYDVVIAGGGHNSLIVGCYLAKAGVKTIVVERTDRAGGSVATRELTGPGFKQDVCSVSHALIQGNPLIRNDELRLLSDYGLKYNHPERISALLFDDGTVLEFWSDLERTCQSMEKIDAKDAANYRAFVETVDKTLDMLVMGMFSVPPDPGTQAMIMNQSPEGQELVRLQQISAWDLICEWVEHPKIRIALARYASETMMDPFDNGTGFGFYLILPFMYKFGLGIAVGGSGALAEALVRCFEDHGGTVRLNSEIDRILLDGQVAKGVVLKGGEEIHAEKAVVAGLHVAQVFPHMVEGAELPPGFEHRLSVLKYAALQPMTVHLALKEPAHFTVAQGIDDFYWVETGHSDVDEFAQGFQELKRGIPREDFAIYVQQFRADATRVPEGMANLHIYAFVPLDLKDGGREKWDEIGEEWANRFIANLRKIAPNVTEENILGKHFMTPLDIIRYNTSLVNGDIQHLGFYSWQLGGNRPIPGWGQYRMPIDRLYLTAGSTHPGGGVTGGPGRNAAQVIFEDLGLDFDSVCG